MKRCYVCRDTENLRKITISLAIDDCERNKQDLFLCSECYKDNVKGNALSIANYIYEDYLYTESLHFMCRMCKKRIPVNVKPRSFTLRYTQPNYHTGEDKIHTQNFVVCPSCKKQIETIQKSLQVLTTQKSLKDKMIITALTQHKLDCTIADDMSNFFLEI